MSPGLARSSSASLCFAISSCLGPGAVGRRLGLHRRSHRADPKLFIVMSVMHDFQAATAAAIEDILGDLEAGGYKIVFMVPKYPVTTIAEYDQMIVDPLGATAPDSRSAAVRTIERAPD
jgi:hypothetical protein